MDSGQSKGSEIAKSIWIVSTPILFTVGVIGNIMTIIVLTSKHNKTTSTSVFLTALAVADLMVVSLVQPRWWFIYLFGIDVRLLSNGVCKVHWFVTYISGTLSTSILMAVTIERVISTVRPHVVKSLCSFKVSVVISTMIWLFVCAVHSHTLYGMKLQNVPLTKQSMNISSGTECLQNMPKLGINATHPSNESIPCIMQFPNTFNSSSNDSFTTERPSAEIMDSFNRNTSAKIETLITARMCWLDTNGKEYIAFYSGPYQYITMIVYTILPAIVLFIGAGIIICKLYQSTKWRRQATQNSGIGIDTKMKTRSIDSQANQITRTLLVVDIVFFVCSTPIMVFLIGRKYWVDPAIGMTETQEVVWAIINQLFYLNHTINFILYFLSGSKFRKLVIKTFCRGDREDCRQYNNSRPISYISTHDASFSRTY